jgi:hypothetical protein
VTDRAQKRRAELLAEAVPGVGHVQNNLRVRQSVAAREPETGASSGRSDRPGPQGTGLGGAEVGPRGSQAAPSGRGRRTVGASG